MEVQESLRRAPDVRVNDTWNDSRREYIDIDVDHDVAHLITDFLNRCGWRVEGSDTGGEMKNIIYSIKVHGIKNACITAPFVFEGADVDELMESGSKLTAEASSAGYHRRFEWAECLCGEHFEEYNDLKEHLE